VDVLCRGTPKRGKDTPTWREAKQPASAAQTGSPKIRHGTHCTAGLSYRTPAEDPDCQVGVFSVTGFDFQSKAQPTPGGARSPNENHHLPCNSFVLKLLNLSHPVC